jgi:tetratricopeptide (TPR) repeat protein
MPKGPENAWKVLEGAEEAAKAGACDAALNGFERAMRQGDAVVTAYAAVARVELLVAKGRWSEVEVSVHEAAKATALDFPPMGTQARLATARARWLRATGSPAASSAQYDADRLAAIDRCMKVCGSESFSREVLGEIAAVDATPGVAAARAKFFYGEALARAGQVDDAIEKIDAAFRLALAEGDVFTICNGAAKRFIRRANAGRYAQADGAYADAQRHVDRRLAPVLLAQVESAAGHMWVLRGRSAEAADAFARSSSLFAAAGHLPIMRAGARAPKKPGAFGLEGEVTVTPLERGEVLARRDHGSAQ